MASGESCNYTEEGLIILPPNVLITKSMKKPKMMVFDFTTIQTKKKGNFFQDVMNEMRGLFKNGPVRPIVPDPKNDRPEEM